MSETSKGMWDHECKATMVDFGTGNSDLDCYCCRTRSRRAFYCCTD